MGENSFVLTKGERILVALDGSVPSKYALENALSLARICKGKIFLIRVLETSQKEEDLSAGGQKLLDDLKKSLERTRKEVEEKGLACETIVHMGPDISSFIVQEAQDKDIDLISMGTHGWTGMTALTMGSVARKVLCSAPCPVLIIPPKLVGEC